MSEKINDRSTENVVPMEARAYQEMNDAPPMLGLYALFDKKAPGFRSPLFAQSRPVAMRMVMNAISEGAGDLSRYPDDFALFHVGEWNERTGELNPRGPEHVCECRALANNLMRLADEQLVHEDNAAVKTEENFPYGTE